MKDEESNSSENDENAHPNIPTSDAKISRSKKETNKKEEVEVVADPPATKVEQKKPAQAVQDSKIDNAYVEWLKLVVVTKSKSLTRRTKILWNPL